MFQAQIDGIISVLACSFLLGGGNHVQANKKDLGVLPWSFLLYLILSVSFPSLSQIDRLVNIFKSRSDIQRLHFFSVPKYKSSGCLSPLIIPRTIIFWLPFV
jgi:hypothetical protein